jgi:hypothetical protein
MHIAGCSAVAGHYATDYGPQLALLFKVRSQVIAALLHPNAVLLLLHAALLRRHARQAVCFEQEAMQPTGWCCKKSAQLHVVATG